MAAPIYPHAVLNFKLQTNLVSIWCHSYSCRIRVCRILEFPSLCYCIIHAEFWYAGDFWSLSLSMNFLMVSRVHYLFWTCNVLWLETSQSTETTGFLFQPLLLPQIIVFFHEETLEIPAPSNNSDIEVFLLSPWYLMKVLALNWTLTSHHYQDLILKVSNPQVEDHWVTSILKNCKTLYLHFCHFRKQNPYYKLFVPSFAHILYNLNSPRF